MSRVLVIDDEPKMTMLISSSLKEAGHNVETASSGKEAMQKLDKESFDLVITDIKLPAPDGMEIQKWISEHRPETIVIMMTAFGTVETAVTALKRGAADYLIKPFPLDELLLLTRRLLENRKTKELKELRERDYERLAYDEFIGESGSARALLDLVAKVAPTETTVLITGESGTGKELAARMIHEKSERRDKPFIAVNCAALTETLLESELFGHEKGAFTGAHERKPGRFELADGGTIFLDEIGEMSAALQAKLLRVLEDRQFIRVGGVVTIPVDVRVVAATNRNLKKMMQDGSFREDLFFRLNVFPIRMPALRERTDDLPLLAGYFLNRKKYPHPKLDDDVLDLFRRYHWPGNIRELKNVLDRATILAGGEPIDQSCLGIDDEDLSEITPTQAGSDKELGEAEKEMILRALQKAGGNKTEAAKNLGITRRKLYSRMKIHGIEP